MKKSIIKTALILIVLGFTMNANAKDFGRNVPQQVRAAFLKQYPQASIRDWKITELGYKAEFKIAHKKQTATYASDGTWLRSATILKRLNDLPESVKSAFKKSRFASFYDDEIKEVTTKDSKTYILIIDNHNGNTIPTEGYGSWEDYQLVYDSNGVLTSVKEL